MKRIAFIGCGNMGEALLKGLLNRGLFKRPYITASDIRASRRNYIKRVYSIAVTSSNTEAARKSDIVILAVKPQNMSDVLEELGSTLKTKLIISIAAGITCAFIRNKTGTRRIIRVMPNTPALTGCGMTAISAAKGVSSSDIKVADSIFSCVGETIHLKERYIDAVTAVSGSGPAYFFLLMEAMIEAANSCGLDKTVAERLVLQTAFGAVALQHNSKTCPSTLREKVTSKGGTTEAAVKVFEKRRFKKLVEDAIKAAAKTAKELSR